MRILSSSQIQVLSILVVAILPGCTDPGRISSLGNDSSNYISNTLSPPVNLDTMNRKSIHSILSERYGGHPVFQACSNTSEEVARVMASRITAGRHNVTVIPNTAVVYLRLSPIQVSRDSVGISTVG